jgi:type I restriction enzyme M protein
MVKPGGRLAMVLPQGVFNNPTQDHVREFILNKARILAVVGLHSNSFKPHTPTKTSVVFLQKWDKEPESERLNYPIFFATQKLTFKDNSGNYINAIDEDGKLQKDSSGNTIFQSDLDEIASKFLEWGMSEGLSFLNEQ